MTMELNFMTTKSLRVRLTTSLKKRRRVPFSSSSSTTSSSRGSRRTVASLETSWTEEQSTFTRRTMWKRLWMKRQSKSRSKCGTASPMEAQKTHHIYSSLLCSPRSWPRSWLLLSNLILEHKSVLLTTFAEICDCQREWGENNGETSCASLSEEETPGLHMQYDQRSFNCYIAIWLTSFMTIQSFYDWVQNGKYCSHEFYKHFIIPYPLQEKARQSK